MLYLVKVEMLDCLSHWQIEVIAPDAETAKAIVRPTLRADEYIYGIEEAA